MHQNSPTNRHLAAALVAALSLTPGCGDLVGAAGEQGHVTYTLYTDYEVDVSDLRAVTLVAGHWQTIHVNLTTNGQAEVGSDPVDHRVVPAEGVEVSVDTLGQVPNLDLRVTAPGSYTIETLHNGEVLDSIDLTFDVPATMRLNPQVRTPWSTEWQSVAEGSLTSIDEGTEVSFIPEPVAANGQQLVGDMDTQLAFDPEWSVVPGANVNGLYTNGWWSLGGPATFYIIEPPDDGTVTATLRDDANGLEVSHTFLVDPVDKL